jgi:hypothetical protein
MADDKTFTKEEVDKAIAEAVGKVQESIDKLEKKNEELIGENRKLKRGAEIKPEDLQAAEERADKAEARAKELEGSVKTLTKERDTAVKSLETEQGAARTYALEAELNGAIAEGNVLPAYVPALKALLAREAKADLVDGKYAVLIGEKPARDYVKAFLEGEEGKAFKAAPVNSGGGAGGSNDNKGSVKTMTRTEFDALPPGDKVAFGKDGGKVVDAAA